jgi:hypothetical protein
MLRDADLWAADQGRQADADLWVENRVAAILADDEELELVMDLYAGCEAFDLLQSVAFAAARSGAGEDARRLRELLRAGAEAMARKELRDRG